ncbi:MAG: dihydropteroate synthase [Candidatus Krumholzibacteria bacterium]|nr:dihydropteroate synthase [Candidatus Krumholzibacteria bacterium]
MRYTLHLVSAPRRSTLERRLRAAGVDPDGIAIMADKAEPVVIRICGLPAAAANILKQQLLSIGGDAAVHRDVIRGVPESSCAYCIADRRRLAGLARALRGQPFGLGEAGEGIERLLELRGRPPAAVSLPAGPLDLSGGPLIMGILNVTPDSFSDGGLFLDPSAAADRAAEMVAGGAAIIDVGGESSRPGSGGTSPEDELRRVAPVLERIAPTIGVPVSIDTRHASTAREALRIGAAIVNDISGLRHDPAMADTVRETGAAVVVMHMLGTPETMQRDPRYDDAAAEIVDWLGAAAGRLVALGVAADKIIVDPGIGFGKRSQDNLDILDRIGDLHTLGYPVCVGYSRKSFIGELTKRREPADRVFGGMAALARCLEEGVQILRVHDVAATRDFIEVWRAIERKDGER